MPTYSVIIPAWQAAGTIGRAVRSALGQTLAPAEVIVCDDGSTDGLRRALAPYSAVKLVRQRHAGVSAASNRAAREARGDFLVKLDADDEWLPGRLAAIDRLLRRSPRLDIVTTDAIDVHLDGTRRRFYAGLPAFPEPAHQRLAILLYNFIFGSAAVRRSAFERAGGFRTDVPHQDEYELWIRLILSGSRAGLVPRQLAYYHRRFGSHGSHSLARYATARAALADAAERFRLNAAERSAVNRRMERLALWASGWVPGRG